MGLINTAFIGHIGTESQIAGAGIANMTCNVFGISFTISLAMTLSTLISQAYGK